jgi:phage antirepressor YoqD-like protein
VFTNIDGFKKYNINTNQVVDIKTARTSIEEKRPFIVAKRGKKLSRTEDMDTIYRTSPKMEISDKSVYRLGFIEVSDRAKEVNIKNKKKNQFRGIANDEFMITKKKGFNQKKIGYLKLEESTPSKDLYVEVTTNRGYKWLLALCGVMCLIGLFIYTRDYSDWHLNLDKMRIYKTKETVEYQESELAIRLNATPVLKDGYVNLNLSSDDADGVTYIARLYLSDSDKLLYESKELQAGEGIGQIEISEELEEGKYDCYLKCESYRNGNYIGDVESTLQLKVKGEE